MKKLTFLLCFLGALSLQAQIRNNDVYEITEMDYSALRTEILIPGFSDYVTLKCDFHIHTVFSDGQVWPNVRVNEAWQQGLDAIAITDHIEYRPYRDVIQGDLNESYKIAKKEGDNIGFIVIKGTEITRGKPLGHLNALFLKDAMALDVEDPLVAIDEAKKQGAFIMWNHPGWPDDKSTLYPVHEELIRDKKIDGVEVFNFMEYYPVSFDWCKDMGLAFMANSDVHGLITSDYGREIRPMTLVFARERTEESIREALFEHRTAAYFNGELAGESDYLQSLVLASLKVKAIGDKVVEVTNVSDIAYKIKHDGRLYIAPARKTIRMQKQESGQMVIDNCHISSSEKLSIPASSFFINR